VRSGRQTRLWVRALPFGIVVGAWVLFLLAAYPGTMSIDSFDQLREARAGFYTDSHPPAMAALWALTEHVVRGPFGMLAIQSVTLIVGLAMILWRVFRPLAAAVITSALFLYPPICAPLAVIWKDCLMAGGLVLGIALITGVGRRSRIAGLVVLMLASAIRYNAFAATLPLVVLLFEWRPGMKLLHRYAIAVGAWFAITVLATGLDGVLADRQMHFWASSFALVDITGTVAMTDDTLPDSELGPLLAPTQIEVASDYQAALRSHYTPGDFVKLIGPPPALWNVELGGDVPAPEAQRDAITHAWWTLVSGHPGGYLKYRYDSLAEVLGMRASFRGTTVLPRHWQRQTALDAFGIPRTDPPLAKTAESIAQLVGRRTPLFRPWFYALLALALLWWARRHREVLAILLSGLVMESSLLFLAVTPDYRYSHWLVVATCLGLVLLVAKRAVPEHLAKPEPEASER